MTHEERITALQEENSRLRAQLAAATGALEPFAKGAEWVGLHIGSEMERRIVAVTGVTSDDWKRAYYLLQAATPPAGAEEDRR
jgi:putative methionine-R-sulfoxide reductase with GAF domain